MSKSAFTDAHRIMIGAMVRARRKAGLHQADLAHRIGKNQSYISNIERGQRRVDVIEFIAIAKAMNVDPVALFMEIAREMPEDISI